MKNYLIAGIGGTLAGILVTTQLAGPLIAQEAGKNASVYQELDLFGSVFERVRQDYVEKVDDKTLIEAAINGMLTSLDPHSSFLSSKDYADMQTQTRGTFGGLGIEVGQEDGLVKVISPIDDTPAAEAGVKPGDLITHVNGELLMGLSLDEAVEKMRGPVGSEITITLLRKDEPEPFDLKIIRDTIKLTVVKSRVEGHAVVLRVSTFNDETYDALKAGLEKAVADAGGIDKVTGFVLDLRNNPGGLLDQAIQVSDAFLDKGEIVSTRGRSPEDSERWNAEKGDLAQGKPMVALINGGSASASEIVTGALQDHRRAIVVGTKSFGKGSVQTVMPVTSDSAIRLTTARYYTPSGRSIQALGINPDIIVAQPKPTPPSDEDKPKTESNFNTSESDLRGALNNDFDQRRGKAPDRGRGQAGRGNRQAARGRLPAGLCRRHPDRTGRGRIPRRRRPGRSEAGRHRRRRDQPQGQDAGRYLVAEACRQARGQPVTQLLGPAGLPYRPCAGVVLANPDGLVFAGQRIDNPGDAWQMPQGGIDAGETPRQAALRELAEETGVPARLVEVEAEMPDWILYDLPPDLLGRIWQGKFCGQRQKWVLMRFTGQDSDVNIATEHAEFDRWSWMRPDELIDKIVPFKRHVYEQVFATFHDSLTGR